MSIEGSPSQEKPEALSLERIDAGAVSISLPEKFKEMPEDELMGELLAIANLYNNALERTGVLFEVIPDIENCSIEIRPFNQDMKISDEVFDIIKGEVEAINASL